MDFQIRSSSEVLNLKGHYSTTEIFLRAIFMQKKKEQNFQILSTGSTPALAQCPSFTSRRPSPDEIISVKSLQNKIRELERHTQQWLLLPLCTAYALTRNYHLWLGFDLSVVKGHKHSWKYFFSLLHPLSILAWLHSFFFYFFSIMVYWYWIYFLVYTVGPCWLSILCTVVWIF